VKKLNKCVLALNECECNRSNPKQNSKRRVFTRLFFISTKNISDAGVNLDSQEVVFLVE